MIKHVVMWRLKNEAKGKNKSINMKLVMKNLLSLKPAISQINSLEIGENFNQTEMACDLVLITTHTDQEALSAYIDHPDYKKVTAFIGKVGADRKVVDFEC